MTDINSNYGGEISKVGGVNFEKAPSFSGSEQIASGPHKEITDLDKAHSALVGRSMVKKVSKTPSFNAQTVANVKGDLAALDKDYKRIKQSVNLEDIAMDRGVSYEKALKMGEEFRA